MLRCPGLRSTRSRITRLIKWLQPEQRRINTWTKPRALASEFKKRRGMHSLNRQISHPKACTENALKRDCKTSCSRTAWLTRKGFWAAVWVVRGMTHRISIQLTSCARVRTWLSTRLIWTDFSMPRNTELSRVTHTKTSRRGGLASRLNRREMILLTSLRSGRCPEKAKTSSNSISTSQFRMLSFTLWFKHRAKSKIREHSCPSWGKPATTRK